MAPLVIEWQLREYRIDPGNFERFLEAWRAGVLPLRRQLGWTIWAWAIPEESRFVWVLGYAGPVSFDDAERAYHASAERLAVDPDPGQWVVEKRNVPVAAVVAPHGATELP
jgi:hypothetical protein